MQPLFSRGPSATLRMIVLVIASIALMTFDHRSHSLEKLRRSLSSFLYPIQYTIDLPIRLYYWADNAISTKQALLKKNSAFETRYMENRIQLQKLHIIEKENQRLRQLLHAKPKTAERLLTAEIINVDIDPYRHMAIINKGTSDEAYLGQPVIDAHGVVGQLTHIAVMSATLTLITDVSHAIPVEVNRNNLRAIAYGSGKTNQLNLLHLPHNVDIRVGDLLISSGLGGTFPANYPVATVSRVDHLSGEPFTTIEATPLAKLNQNREVLLLWREEIGPKLPANIAEKIEPLDSAQTNEINANNQTESTTKQAAPTKAKKANTGG